MLKAALELWVASPGILFTLLRGSSFTGKISDQWIESLINFQGNYRIWQVVWLHYFHSMNLRDGTKITWVEEELILTCQHLISTHSLLITQPISHNQILILAFNWDLPDRHCQVTQVSLIYCIPLVNLLDKIVLLFIPQWGDLTIAADKSFIWLIIYIL